MKTVLSTLLVLLCNMSFSQNLDYKNLKQLIGNRVNELEDFYKISSTSIEDNFVNQKVMYNSVKIEPYTVNLEVETEGKNLEAGFNPKYFLDALRAIDDPEVFIDFGSSISPCIIRPTEENGDYIYMVLPIRMKE